MTFHHFHIHGVRASGDRQFLVTIRMSRNRITEFEMLESMDGFLGGRPRETGPTISLDLSHYAYEEVAESFRLMRDAFMDRRRRIAERRSRAMPEEDAQ